MLTKSKRVAMTFKSLGISPPICKALKEKKYQSPTPIQQKAIPTILANKDVIAAAQTGTGKTAAFTLPLIDKLSKSMPNKSGKLKVLIVTPTRELANQIYENIGQYSKYTKIKSAVIFGGVKIGSQIRQLQQGVDMLVATPGRLLDLFFQKVIQFNDIETLVLDEADRMLDMGFIHDIKKIVQRLPKKRQTLLFSATFSNEIRRLSEKYVYQPVEIDVSPRNTVVKKISELVFPVDKKRKPALLRKLVQAHNLNQVLVFTKTKRGANKLTEYLLLNDIEALAIHGNKSQNARNKALSDFKSGQIQVLVATDIAARGIDIKELPSVVNYELPSNAEDYIHRIGRTGRAGKDGHAYSLVCYEEYSLLNAVETLTQKKIKRKIEAGFAPSLELPHSQLNRRKPIAKMVNKAPKTKLFKSFAKKKTTKNKKK